ncbi:alanine racemase [Nocardioides acrostichi]|uniref:Alanine racemase n=1 Tax=Nocardioides acrostichi TaxID=2784339 RepID=A0A930UUJ1_9ACTN|nr:alanine racemase [Nocardioides acrostichi]MBF4161103.1 alanine racemase [Nocardioides acrostichi]
MTALAVAATRSVAPAATLEIDLAAVGHNAALLARTVAPTAALMAVVKADGFGHGAIDVARTALTHGATWLGVTGLTEALDLRGAGLTAPLLSWLNPVDLDAATALEARVDLAVPSIAHLRTIATAAHPSRPAHVHLHLDTGMARDGAAPEEWTELCLAARAVERTGRVRIVGLMGHLACADAPGHPANAAARARFARGTAVARALGLRPTHRHLAATSAALTDPLTHHDLVRAGAGLVGIDPTGAPDRHGLRPAMRLTAPVVGVRRVPAGTGVGYGHTHLTDRATTLALLPLGYADGLPRLASGRAEVLLAGRRRSIVGRISMDQVVVDLRDDAVVPGTPATVLGPGDDGEPTAADWAAWSDSLEHEVLTGLGTRPRLLHTTRTPQLRSLS